MIAGVGCNNRYFYDDTLPLDSIAGPDSTLGVARSESIVVGGEGVVLVDEG